jgi:hypothetical protein
MDALHEVLVCVMQFDAGFSGYHLERLRAGHTFFSSLSTSLVEMGYDVLAK